MLSEAPPDDATPISVRHLWLAVNNAAKARIWETPPPDLAETIKAKIVQGTFPRVYMVENQFYWTGTDDLYKYIYVGGARDYEELTSSQISEELPNQKLTAASTTSYRVPDGLPDTPLKLWPGRSRGRPKAGSPDPLLDFLRTVYGPYYADHRQSLRIYIYHKDPALYRAIFDFERRTELPAELSLPTRTDTLKDRLARAAKGDYPLMTKRERRSVARIVRDNAHKPKKG